MVGQMFKCKVCRCINLLLHTARNRRGQRSLVQQQLYEVTVRGIHRREDTTEASHPIVVRGLQLVLALYAMASQKEE